MTQLWRHQTAAVEFCREKRSALIACGLGTGKSAIALKLIEERLCARTLVVAPLSVLPVWKKQAELHAPEIHVLVLDEGSIAKRAERARKMLNTLTPRPLIIVINYDAAWRGDFGEFVKNAMWDMVIADEGHALDSPGSKRSLFFSLLKANVHYKLALSGTPMTQSPLTVYGLYRFLDPTIFGTSYTRFKNKYAVWGGFQFRQVLSYVNQDDFRRKFYSIAFRVETKDVLDLPPVQHIERTFTLSGEARRVYDELKNEFVADLKAGRIMAVNALARATRFQQITSGFIPIPSNDGTDEKMEVLHASKSELLKEALEEIDPSEPVVVFCRFTLDIANAHVASHATGRQTAELSGNRNELADWQSGTANVLIVQIQAGAMGIDLTRARYCIFFSNTFSLATYQQALARTHRPGQARTVTYIHLICEGTVDRKIYKSLAANKDVITSILEDGIDA